MLVSFFFLPFASLSPFPVQLTRRQLLFGILHWAPTLHVSVFPSLSFSLPLWRPFSLTHFTLASLLFIWLSHLFCHLGPLLKNPSPLTCWLSSWFLRLYQFVCQVGTGDAAGCRLTSVSLSLQLTSSLFETLPLSSRFLLKLVWAKKRKSFLEAGNSGTQV